MHAVEEMINAVLNAFEEKLDISAALIDLSKAFDSISHEIIIRKLYYYGIQEIELNLIRSYLDNRNQVVVVNNQTSDLKKIQVGVPQGSVLGPLLFLIAINDLPFYVNNIKAILYADDTTFLSKASNLNKCQAEIQKTIRQSEFWFEMNNLKVNTDKTEYINFSLKTPPQHKSVKFLGIYVDNRLNWNTHTQNVIVKLSRVIYLLRKLRLSVSNTMLTTAYYAFFHPHLLYGIRLWGNSSGASQVFICQKKAVRAIMGAKNSVTCRQFFKDLKIMTLPSLYIYCNLIYVKENLENLNTRASIHSHETRNKNRLELPCCRLNKTLSSHLYVQQKLFNKLPIAARYIPLIKFKKAIKTWLISKIFYSVDDYFNCDTFDLAL